MNGVYESLENRVAVVTGGTTGIGFSIAKRLLQSKMRVVINGLSIEQGMAAAAGLAEFGENIQFVAADVGTTDGVRSLFDHVGTQYGRLDLLCNNAGIHRLAKIADMDVATWDQVIQNNLRSAFLCSKAALEGLNASGGGSIVNIASVGGLAGYATGAAYCPSKAGMIMLSRTLALELAPAIRVNCICPGSIATDMLGPGAETRVAPQIPVRRLGKSDEVADLVAFLASDRAGYISGSVIPVDGGATAGRVRYS